MPNTQGQKKNRRIPSQKSQERINTNQTVLCRDDDTACAVASFSRTGWPAQGTSAGTQGIARIYEAMRVSYR